MVRGITKWQDIKIRNLQVVPCANRGNTAGNLNINQKTEPVWSRWQRRLSQRGRISWSENLIPSLRELRGGAEAGQNNLFKIEIWME